MLIDDFPINELGLSFLRHMGFGGNKEVNICGKKYNLKVCFGNVRSDGVNKNQRKLLSKFDVNNLDERGIEGLEYSHNKIISNYGSYPRYLYIPTNGKFVYICFDGKSEKDKCSMPTRKMACIEFEYIKNKFVYTGVSYMYDTEFLEF